MSGTPCDDGTDGHRRRSSRYAIRSAVLYGKRAVAEPVNCDACNARSETKDNVNQTSIVFCFPPFLSFASHSPVSTGYTRLKTVKNKKNLRLISRTSADSTFKKSFLGGLLCRIPSFVNRVPSLCTVYKKSEKNALSQVIVCTNNTFKDIDYTLCTRGLI